MSAGKIARYGLLTGVMLVLGYVESLLPVVGIPGIKLGLSNTVLLYALCLMDAKSAVLLAVLKVLLSGFFVRFAGNDALQRGGGGFEPRRDDAFGACSQREHHRCERRGCCVP